MVKLFLVLSLFTLFEVSEIRAQQYSIGRENKSVQLKLSSAGKKPNGRLKLVIRSGRNESIPKMKDRSQWAPADFVYPPEVPGKEIWFPVIDMPLSDSFVAVAKFEGVEEGDSVCFNGNFVKDCRPLKSRMEYATHLEHWENQLFVKSDKASLKSFYFEKIIELPEGARKGEKLSLKTLAEDWYGTIDILEETSTGRWEKKETITIPKKRAAAKQQKKDFTTISKDLVLDALHSSVGYLLKSQNQNPLSPTYGGLYLFYDKAAETYRRSDWIWSYGPAIKVLVESAQIPEIERSFGYENLSRSARLVAEASLRFQQLNENHPAYGLVMCRYDPRTDSPQGAEGYYSPADSYFLAGWGWMPYYRFSKDPRFLEASLLMTEQVGRILTYDDIVEQDYLMKAGKWKNWTMDESGFGMQGASEIYAVTGKRNHQVIGKIYIEGLLNKLEREDGLWDRTWHRNDPLRANNGWPIGAPKGEPVLIETAYSTRGLGWAMIGLLATHRMLPEGDKYLEKAKKLASHLQKHQEADGHWVFLFDGSAYEGEISEKGTALWSLLFYDLYHFTKDENHLQTARKALLWCINQQDQSSDPQVIGGIVGLNRESGVVYRRWYPLSCSYTVSWFGLALLEELKVIQAAEVGKE